MPDKIVPVALRLWLLFLFVFLLLGYEVISCVVFGAIAGFAGGTVHAWWTTPGGEPQPTEAPAVANPLRKWGERIKPSRLQERMPFLRLFTRRDRRLGRIRKS
ncbi:MAG: hypothetical protein O3C67_01630 [Cyanobacteria bacterium]|nr:hypothetical protein [Cyanobacteriota bacterium]MEB3267752.1 hypothetical protein [Leptolyngbya sp.]